MDDIKTYEFGLKRIRARQGLEQAIVTFLIIEGQTKDPRKIREEVKDILKHHEPRVKGLLAKLKD